MSLINVFAAQMCYWFGMSLFYLGHPFRAYHVEYISCFIAYSVLRIATTMVSRATTLYAGVVYSYVKYGKNRFKWCGMSLFIALSWIFALLVSLVPHFIGIDANTRTLLGFCGTYFSTRGFLAASAFQLMTYALCLCAIFVFCTLIFHHMKRNTLEDNNKVKGAVVKNLIGLSRCHNFFDLSHQPRLPNCCDRCSLSDRHKQHLAHELLVSISDHPPLTGYSDYDHCAVETSSCFPQAHAQDLLLQEERFV